METLRKRKIMDKRLSKRIDKLEAKAEFIQTESKAKKAKLLRLEQLEKDDSIEAMFLGAELQTGQKLSLIDIIALVRASRHREKMNETVQN